MLINISVAIKDEHGDRVGFNLHTEDSILAKKYEDLAKIGSRLGYINKKGYIAREDLR